MNRAPSKDTGAVLLTTLLLMTVMAAITIAIIDDIRLSIQHTANIQTSEQIDWFERGAETYAKAWLEKNIANKQTKLASIIVKGAEITFPIEDGQIRITVRDHNNCYNLNYLANEQTHDRSRRQFKNFLTLSGFDNFQAETLSASIQDWVDSDTRPNQGGAEGFSYSNQTPPYHAANTFMVDISELRAVQGISEDVFQALKPFVCAQPTDKAARLNLNTLNLEQAPLLALLFGADSAALKTARTVIAQRPAEGYDSPEQVWALAAVQELELKGAGMGMARIKTDTVAFNINVQYQSQTRVSATVLTIGDNNSVRIASRRSKY